MSRRYDDVERFVDRLQTICRPMRLTPMPLALGTVLQERRAAWVRWLSARGRPLEWSPPREDPTTTLDGVQLSHALDTLVSWRGEQGGDGEPARLSWRVSSGELRLSWHEPATPLEAPSPDSAPALALPLLARVASAHGGRLLVSAGPGFGVEVVLPVEFDPQAEWATGTAYSPQPLAASTSQGIVPAPRLEGRPRA